MGGLFKQVQFCKLSLFYIWKLLTLYLQLRRIFHAIQAIKNRSGWTWSDETGASITPDMEDAWGDFLKIYREAKPFKNHSWIHLEKMTIIMLASLKGYHIFHPLQGLSGIGSLHDNTEDMPPYTANTQEEDETADDKDAHPTAAVSLFRCIDHQCLYFLGVTFNPNMFLLKTGVC